MADVVVNIRGDASQLKDELNNISNSSDINMGGRGSDNSRPEPLPPDNRLLEELKDEIKNQRGTGNVKEAAESVKQSELSRISEEIAEKLNYRLENMQKRMQADYDKIDKDVDQQKAEKIESMGGAYDDPIHKQTIDNYFEKLKDDQYHKVGKQYDEEESKIKEQTESERSEAEKELILAMKDLSENFKKHGNEESYINQLRQKRKEALYDRDDAMDEEGATDAQKRVTEIEDQLKRVMGGGKKDEEGAGDRTDVMTGGMGMMGFMNSMSRGDIGGMAVGGATAISGFAGLGKAAAMRLNAYALAAAGLTSLLKSGGSEMEGLGGLARLGVNGAHGAGSVDALENSITKQNYGGKSYEDYAMNTSEFADVAAKRSKTRGSTKEWYSGTMESIGLESSLGLDKGSLTGASKYDRYGENVTDAIAKLVTTLNRIQGSGVEKGDFTRVQEKFDIQQQIMGGYMNRTDKPNFDIANKTVSAFSSTPGITQDARMGGDIQQFQNMLQNPMNDRMKALIYSEVAKAYPETAGRTDLMDRALKDPDKEGKLIAAVVARVEKQYGGTDTRKGYFAYKHLLEGMAPDHMDKYVKAINHGETGRMLKEGVKDKKTTDVEASKNVELWTKEAADYLSKINKNMEALHKIWTGITFWSPLKPNQPK